MPETIELPYVTLFYDAPVVFCRYKADHELGFPEIREMVTASERLSSGKPYVTLADVRKGLRITQQGKKLAASRTNMPLFRGTAVLVTSDLLRLAANMMNEIVSRNYPYKVFTDEEKAVSWLRSLPLEAEGAS